jgi:hypothetical protein
VQHRSAQCLIFDLAGLVKPGEDRRDYDRVSDIRVAAAAQLAVMPSRGDIAGTPDQLDVSVGRAATTTWRNSAARSCQATPTRP